MIVKVQRSISSSDRVERMLIYNEPRDIFYESIITYDVKKLLAGRHKAYFYAEMEGTEVILGDEAPVQQW